MPKYLFQASYTAEGVRGILKEGGSSRRDHIAELARGLGGTLESFYFAFGGTDAFVIAELPDNATAAAVSLAVSAGGAAGVTTNVLMPPEEMDQAVSKTVNYRPPGG